MSSAKPALASADERWMRRALSLARRGEGSTRPNPPVGAVVIRHGVKIGEGYHRKAGGPHAEVIALRAAGRAAKGATLYVTLEPCSTWGRTPPCTDAVKVAGITRVVAATRDPNPAHAGRGIRLLRRAGIKVTEGVCGDEARHLIAPFAKWITARRPYVTLKMGMSLDGRIADLRGRSRWITGEAARQRVQDLRRRVDAVMVGSRTARLDNPSLLPAQGNPNLYRIIVDSTGRLPLNAKVLNDDSARRTILATTRRCSKARRQRYGRRGIQVWDLKSTNGRVSLKDLFHKAGAMGLLHVLCEGGGELAEGLIRAGLVDEYLFFIAPRVLGGQTAAPVVAGNGWSLTDAPRLEFLDYERVGDDLLIRAVPRG